jgi:hypothetical protein
MLLFVYGNEMDKGAENHLIADKELPNNGRLASAFTHKRFHMVKKKLGQHSYPIALELQPSLVTRTERIKGELWKVRPERYLELDKYMENRVFFRRRRVQVTIPCYITVKREFNSPPDPKTVMLLGGTKRGPYAPSCEAWMYIGEKEYWEPQLDAGYIFQKCPIFVAKNPKTWVSTYTQFIKE